MAEKHLQMKIGLRPGSSIKRETIAINMYFYLTMLSLSCADLERGTGGPHPSREESQSYEASTQCCAIMSTPMKTTFMAFRWRADDGPLFVVNGSPLPSSS